MNALVRKNFMIQYILGTALLIDKQNTENQKIEAKEKLKNQKSNYNIRISYNNKELDNIEIDEILEKGSKF